VTFSHPNRCARCKERVTPFAAGCAICGADLDPRRDRRVPLSRRIGSAWDAFTLSTELVVLAIVVVLALSYLILGGI
jgi:hypothetical protein